MNNDGISLLNAPPSVSDDDMYGKTGADESSRQPDGSLKFDDPTYGLGDSETYDALMANPLVSYIANISGTYGVVDAIEGVDYTKLTPFIATLDRYTNGVSMSGLKQMKVSALMIEAGYLYDTAHNQVWSNNPKLRQQCQEATGANLPFGLYMTCKARTVAEAKEEMYYFSFHLRKFPPILGAWVSLNLVTSKTVNDLIIDCYQKELERLGFKNKMGLYVSDNMIGNISWTTHHKQNWLLWLNRHVSTMIELGEQITPAFFKI